MQLGIIGMPLTGKTTVFELLTDNKSTPHKSGKINTAMAKIPDKRIDYLSGLYKPKKTIYAQLEIVDIPGLVPGAEKATIMFLDAVRKADALLQVVRVFKEPSVPVFDNEIDPVKDIEYINYELLMADLDLIEKRIERINSNKKRNQMLKELKLLEKLKDTLEDEKPLSAVELDPEEKEIMATYQFLTIKPMLLCLNVSEDELLKMDYFKKNETAIYAKEHNLPLIEISANLEREIFELEAEEKDTFMNELGIEEAGIVKISRTMYRTLGLVSFFTVGEDEVKAWTVKEGTPARQAAGKIHSDIERGFIRAEVVDYNDLKEFKNMNTIKEKGFFRLEGKEYIVKDGDIIHFRFNV